MSCATSGFRQGFYKYGHHYGQNFKIDELSGVKIVQQGRPGRKFIIPVIENELLWNVRKQIKNQGSFSARPRCSAEVAMSAFAKRSIRFS